MKDREKVKITLDFFRQNSPEKWPRLYEDFFQKKLWHVGPENEEMTPRLYGLLKRNLKFQLGINFGDTE